MKAEVTVTVTKDGHTLTATKALPTDTEFNNTFTPAATSAQFKFTKKLEGKALEADAFTFELLENGQVLQTKKNGADGTIQFDAISYDKEGTHTYTVREVAGTDTDIDYDTMNAEVTVNVTKNATTGILTANVVMPTDSEFNNYAVVPVTAQFDFSKVLSGRTLKDGEFSFVLKDATGKVLQTKKNGADGKVSFDALTYKNNEVGIHKYTVEEVAGSEAGMSYDPMKAEVTVTVTKDGHTLTATKALPTDTEFDNTFTPPTPPTPIVPPVTPPIPPTPEVQTVKSVTSLTPVVYEDVKGQELPKTGDNKSEVAIEVGGLLTLVGLVLSRKRKNNS